VPVGLTEELYGIERTSSADLIQDDDDRRHRQAERAIEPWEAVRRFNRLVVLGEPGAGKTTYLCHLAFMCARRERLPHYLPIFLRLRDLTGVPRLEDALLAELNNRRFPNAGNYLRRQLAAGRCLILLDGLDEVESEAEHRRRLADLAASGDAAQRRAAAAALGRIAAATPETVRTLRANLAHPDPAARAEAARALARLAAADDETVAALLRLYPADPADIARHAALEALLALGRHADVGMVLVPAGEFLMGSADDDRDAEDDEKPQHRVYLPAYALDRTPVTNAQYRRFIEAGGVCESRVLERGDRRGTVEGRRVHRLRRLTAYPADLLARYRMEQRSTAGRRRQLVRGAGLRALGRQAAAHGGRVGEGGELGPPFPPRFRGEPSGGRNDVIRGTISGTRSGVTRRNRASEGRRRWGHIRP